MSWQFFLLIYIVLGSVAAILQKVLLRDNKIDPLGFSVTFQLVCGFIMGSVGLLSSEMTYPPLLPLIGNLVIMIALYGFGNILYFHAVRENDVSDVTVVFASRAIFTVIASSIFLRESLAANQLFGSFCILLAVVLVSMKHSRFHINRGMWLTLLAAFCFGVAITNDRAMLQVMGVYPYVTLGFLLPAFVMIGVYRPDRSKITVLFQHKSIVTFVVLCLTYSLAAIAFFSALKLVSNSSVFAILNQITTVIIVMGSVVFLGERDNVRNKILGSIVAFVGLVLLRT